MTRALKILFLLILPIILINCSTKNQPSDYTRHESYAEVNSALGCGSGFNKLGTTIYRYTNYFMTWPGKITAFNGGSAYLDLDGKNMPDLRVEFLHGHAGDKLTIGDIILVRFKFKTIGGCIAPIIGEEATIEPRFLNLAWWKFFLAK